MEDAMRTELIEAGIDVDEVLERFMNNEGLLKRFLKKFLEDPNYRNLQSALERKDMDTAATAAHTLKGVCGNLSMTELFMLLTRQVDLLRRGDWEEARALMIQIAPAYEKVCRGIENTC